MRKDIPHMYRIIHKACSFAVRFGVMLPMGLLFFAVYYMIFPLSLAVMVLTHDRFDSFVRALYDSYVRLPRDFFAECVFGE